MSTASGVNQAVADAEAGPHAASLSFSSSRSSTTAPLGTGLPTQEELLVHYPAKFTWKQLKTFVNSGDLGLLKRDKKLQQRYDLWAVGIKEKYGSIVNYLKDYRLQWGKRDTLSLIPTTLDAPGSTPPFIGVLGIDSTEAPEYFTADTPAQYISVIQNDWPYSVPPEIEHTLIWTRIPIYHPSIVPPSISVRVAQDGLWGFTGLSPSSPPPSPSTLHECLPALAEWGVTREKMVVSERGTEEEDELVKSAGRGIDEWVRKRWREEEWVTAWFVNPPRLQSVPGLAHIHVFARRKL